MADASIRIKVIDDASVALKRIQGSVEGLAGPLRALGGVGAAAGITAAVASLRQMVGAIDDLAEAAEGLGTTAVELAELRAAGQQAGVGAETLDKALTSLNLKIAAAVGGNKEAVDFFKRLGIAFQEAGRARSGLAVLGDFADRFREFDNDARKAALGAEAFGQKVGPKLAALLNQGAPGLRTYVGLTDETVQQSIALQSQLDKLTVSWERLKNEILGGVVPAINQYIDAVKFLQDNNRASDFFTKGGIRALLDAQRDLKSAAESNFLRDLNDPAKQAQQSLSNLLPKKQAPSVDEAASRRAAELAKQLADAQKIGADAAREYRDTGLKAFLEEEARGYVRAAATLAEYNRSLQEAADAQEEFRQTGLAERRRVEEADAARERARVDQFNRDIDETKRSAEELGLVFESALSKLITGGEFNARNFFTALAQDITQTIIKIQLLEPIIRSLKAALSDTGGGASFFETFFKTLGSSYAGARAGGGPVAGGSAYLVGERGPEIFVPGVSGMVVPNGGMGVTVQQNISIDARSDIATIRQAMVAARDAAVREVGNQLARRGALSRV